jgi:hypothetical protein
VLRVTDFAASVQVPRHEVSEHGQCAKIAKGGPELDFIMAVLFGICAGVMSSVRSCVRANIFRAGPCKSEDVLFLSNHLMNSAGTYF